jgi:DNA-binding transcriptional MocR family regulator
VVARLKKSILNRHYQSGDALPSENQMADQFGVRRVVGGRSAEGNYIQRFGRDKMMAQEQDYLSQSERTNS